MTPRARRIVFVCAALLGLAFLALGERAEDQGEGAPWFAMDLATKSVIQSTRRPALEHPIRLLSDLGTARGLVPLGFATVVALWWRHRRLALFVPSVMLGAGIVEALSKWGVNRPRPRLTGYGFPSGHVLAAVTFYGALVYVCWVLTRRPAWRWIATGACVLVILGVGYTRIYLNAHWLTDVLGALLGGTAYLLLALAWIDARWRPRHRAAVPAPARR
ncbi:MAG TPA: phosphatase PAP2 family protein [Methylomirabilota bacterium]|nr:phosphatase PAP2 family protein [Methylomirabilota bacterium]